jgi:iron complex transport system ATP-binding protein
VLSAAAELEGVSVRLGADRVVQEVSATIARGEWVGLIGPNGAGKTTLLRALAGLVGFEGGVVLDARPLGSAGRREIARRVALVLQSPRTPGELTVAEYVLLGRTPHISPLGAEGRLDRLAAERAIARLGLRPFASRRLATLSGGERQRAALARALAQDAPLLLLDEPTSALDLGAQQQALELIDRLRQEEALTVISAMHDLSLAGQFADRLLLLDRGRLVADGPASEVLSERSIAAHYGASVRVMHEDDRIFVLPRREVRA